VGELLSSAYAPQEAGHAPSDKRVVLLRTPAVRPSCGTVPKQAARQAPETNRWQVVEFMYERSCPALASCSPIVVVNWFQLPTIQPVGSVKARIDASFERPKAYARLLGSRCMMMA